MGFLARYRNIPRSTLYIIGAKLLCALVGASFMLILNIFLRKRGMSDVQIGSIAAFQYAGGLLLSLPQGLLLRGRRLKPFLLAGAMGVPVLALLVLLCFHEGYWMSGKCLLLLLSMSLLQLDSFSLPFIVRTQHKASEPEAISLAYATHAAATILSGLLIIALGTWWADSFVASGEMEYVALSLIACAAIPAVVLVMRAKEPVPDPSGKIVIGNLGAAFKGYDWVPLAKGLFPTMLLAIGAGLTIPFINLYFNAVFKVDSAALAIIGMCTSGLVFFTAIAVPAIRRRFGYEIAITLMQCLAVLMLIGLALTELFAHLPWMVGLAIAFFMLRGPLMNMAGPMSNELVMNYVGKRNQDLAGALHASIWGGAWFVSARIFEVLRGSGIPYYQIFLSTACLYMVAIFLYFLLIRDYSRRLKE